MMTTAFSQIRHDIEDLIADGNKIVCRMNISAKHRGDFQGTAPTGKSVSFGSQVIWRVGDGRAVEMWVQGRLFGPDAAGRGGGNSCNRRLAGTAVLDKFEELKARVPTGN